jgi:hypothetical protein
MLCSGMARLSTVNTKPIVKSLLIFQPKLSFDIIMHSNVLQIFSSIFCPLLSEIPHELISVIEECFGQFVVGVNKNLEEKW